MYAFLSRFYLLSLYFPPGSLPLRLQLRSGVLSNSDLEFQSPLFPASAPVPTRRLPSFCLVSVYVDQRNGRGLPPIFTTESEVSHIISYHIISYHIISYHIISYHIISYHIISYHIISYHIISYHNISYQISYHTRASDSFSSFFFAHTLTFQLLDKPWSQVGVAPSPPRFLPSIFIAHSY